MGKFCFLGIIGKCGSDAESKVIQKTQISVLNTFLNEHFIKTLNNSTSTIDNIQEIFAEADGNIIISDINLKQYAKLTSNTQIDVESSIQEEKTIDEMIDALAKVNLDVESQTQGISMGSNTYTETVVETIIDIKKQFKSIIKEENISQCINNIFNQQSIKAKSKQDILITGIRLEQTSIALTECLIKSVNNIFSKIKLSEEIKVSSDTDVKAKSKSQGLLANILERLGNIFKLLPLFVIILIVVVITIPLIILAILIITFMVTRRRRRSKNKNK